VARIITLDSEPAGIACGDPNKHHVAAFLAWSAVATMRERTLIILTEIVDYEVRRKLLANNDSDGAASIRRLDDMVRPGGPIVYVPITTKAMRTAARLWSKARRGGYSTADPKALDGDVILAAQSRDYCGQSDQLWVATKNVKDLSRYVDRPDRVQPWDSITP
jgi:predicted nucleic acid-binding protein